MKAVRCIICKKVIENKRNKSGMCTICGSRERTKRYSKSYQLRELEREANRRKNGCGEKFLLRIVKSKKGKYEEWTYCDGTHHFCKICKELNKLESIK